MTAEDRSAPGGALPQAAFYARGGSSLADWWTLLHPPYTIWNLSYVVIGAALAPTLHWDLLGLTALAFLLAVGVAAHALDELNGRPLRTSIGGRTLRAAAGLTLATAVGIGVIVVVLGAVWVLVLIPVGALLVVGYNLELFGGRLHTDWGFALSWGGFPVVTGYLAQDPRVGWRSGLVLAAATSAATASAYAQRQLSTPARTLRRRVVSVEGSLRYTDGRTRPLGRESLLEPLEGTLRALAWTVPLTALALLLGRAL